jgi:hypothetical protein
MCLLLAYGSVVMLAASPPVIGVARSRGAFLINDASVPGTATILDGTSVKTLGLSSDVKLTTGERVTLRSGSAAAIYQDHLVLQSGMAEVDHPSAYRVDAAGFRIGASDPDASFRVAVNGSRQVQVVATAGTAEVRNAKGGLVARILSGTALELRMTPGDAATDLTGMVTSEHGKFFLTDETTKVKYELLGSGVSALVGKRAHVTGSIAAATKAGDPAVVTVDTATGLPAAAAGAAGGGAAAGAATAGGVSATAIVLIGAGVAGGTLGGLAAAGTFSGSTVSR